MLIVGEGATTNRTIFDSIIREFGTHYVHRLIGGGKRVTSVTLGAVSVDSLETDGVNVALGAAFNEFQPGCGVNVFTSGTAVTFELQKQAFEAIEASVIKTRDITHGGFPFVRKCDTYFDPLLLLIANICLLVCVNSYVAAY